MAGISTAMQHLAGALRGGSRFKKVNKLGKLHGTTATGKELFKRRILFHGGNAMANLGSLVGKLGKLGSKAKKLIPATVRKNPGKSAAVGAYAGAVGTQYGFAGKSVHDVYKQRRQEGESKTGAVLRTVDPFHTYGSGKRIARYNARTGAKWGKSKSLIGQSIPGLIGYQKEKKRLATMNNNFQKVRRVKKNKSK